MSTLLKCSHCVNYTFRNKHQLRQHIIIKHGKGTHMMKENEEDNLENSNNVSATQKNVKGSTTSSIPISCEVKHGRHFQNSSSSKIVKENGKSSAAPSAQTFVEGNKHGDFDMTSIVPFGISSNVLSRVPSSTKGPYNELSGMPSKGLFRAPSKEHNDEPSNIPSKEFSRVPSKVLYNEQSSVPSQPCSRVLSSTTELCKDTSSLPSIVQSSMSCRSHPSVPSKVNPSESSSLPSKASSIVTSSTTSKADSTVNSSSGSFKEHFIRQSDSSDDNQVSSTTDLRTEETGRSENNTTKRSYLKSGSRSLVKIDISKWQEIKVGKDCNLTGKLNHRQIHWKKLKKLKTKAKKQEDQKDPKELEETRNNEHFESRVGEIKAFFKYVPETDKEIYKGSKVNDKYLCKECNYSTPFRNKAKRHHRVHTNVCPYHCLLCKHKAKTSHNVKIHIRTIHKDRVEDRDKNLTKDYKHLEVGPKYSKIRTIEEYGEPTEERAILSQEAESQHSGVNKQYYKFVSEEPAQKYKPRRDKSGLYRCHFCTYRSYRIFSVRNHHRIHTGARPYHCLLCDHKTKVCVNMKQHIRMVHSKNKTKQSGEDDNKHDPKYSKIRTKENYAEPYQARIIPSQEAESQHSGIYKHYYKFVPEEPSQRYKPRCDKSGLYRCHFCMYRNSRIDIVRNHHRIHTKARPYHCLLCDHKTKVCVNMRKHIRKVHSKNKTKQNREYATRSKNTSECCEAEADKPTNEYQQYYKVTTDKVGKKLKPKKDRSSGLFRCRFCSYRAKNIFHVENHHRIHFGIRPYQCLLCAHRSKRLAHIIVHIKSVHREKLASVKMHQDDNAEHAFNRSRHATLQHQTVASSHALSHQIANKSKSATSTTRLKSIEPAQLSTDDDSEHLFNRWNGENDPQETSQTLCSQSKFDSDASRHNSTIRTAPKSADFEELFSRVASSKEDHKNHDESCSTLSKGISYHCRRCDFRCSNQDGLIQHLRYSHKPNVKTKPRTKTSLVKAKSRRKTRLGNVWARPLKRAASSRLECPFPRCYFTHRREAGIEVHAKTHSSEPVYFCVQCTFSCYLKRTFAKHLSETHSGSSMKQVLSSTTESETDNQELSDKNSTTQFSDVEVGMNCSSEDTPEFLGCAKDVSWNAALKQLAEKVRASKEVSTDSRTQFLSGEKDSNKKAAIRQKNLTENCNEKGSHQKAKTKQKRLSEKVRIEENSTYSLPQQTDGEEGLDRDLEMKKKDQEVKVSSSSTETTKRRYMPPKATVGRKDYMDNEGNYPQYMTATTQKRFLPPKAKGRGDYLYNGSKDPLHLSHNSKGYKCVFHTHRYKWKPKLGSKKNMLQKPYMCCHCSHRSRTSWEMKNHVMTRHKIRKPMVSENQNKCTCDKDPSSMPDPSQTDKEKQNFAKDCSLERNMHSLENLSTTTLLVDVNLDTGQTVTSPSWQSEKISDNHSAECHLENQTEDDLYRKDDKVSRELAEDSDTDEYSFETSLDNPPKLMPNEELDLACSRDPPFQVDTNDMAVGEPDDCSDSMPKLSEYISFDINERDKNQELELACSGDHPSEADTDSMPLAGSGNCSDHETEVSENLSFDNDKRDQNDELELAFSRDHPSGADIDSMLLEESGDCSDHMTEVSENFSFDNSIDSADISDDTQTESEIFVILNQKRLRNQSRIDYCESSSRRRVCSKEDLDESPSTTGESSMINPYPRGKPSYSRRFERLGFSIISVDSDTAIEEDLRRFRYLQCPQCGLQSETVESNLDHFREHTGYQPYLCTFCGFQTGFEQEVKAHIADQIVDKEKLKKLYTLKSDGGLNSQIKIQRSRITGEYECPDCKKRFSYLGNAKQHHRVHTKEKPYHCNLCNYKASQQKGVLQHIKGYHRKCVIICPKSKEDTDECVSVESDAQMVSRKWKRQKHRKQMTMSGIIMAKGTSDSEDPVTEITCDMNDGESTLGMWKRRKEKMTHKRSRKAGSVWEDYVFDDESDGGSTMRELRGKRQIMKHDTTGTKAGKDVPDYEGSVFGMTQDTDQVCTKQYQYKEASIYQNSSQTSDDFVSTRCDSELASEMQRTGGEVKRSLLCEKPFFDVIHECRGVKECYQYRIGAIEKFLRLKLKRLSKEMKMKRKHDNSQAKFSCPFCNKGFNDLDLSLVHIGLHTGEKPYSCMLCDFSTVYGGKIVSHGKQVHQVFDGEMGCDDEEDLCQVGGLSETCLPGQRKLVVDSDTFDADRGSLKDGRYRQKLNAHRKMMSPIKETHDEMGCLSEDTVQCQDGGLPKAYLPEGRQLVADGDEFGSRRTNDCDRQDLRTHREKMMLFEKETHGDIGYVAEEKLWCQNDGFSDTIIQHQWHLAGPVPDTDKSSLAGITDGTDPVIHGHVFEAKSCIQDQEEETVVHSINEERNNADKEDNMPSKDQQQQSAGLLAIKQKGGSVSKADEQGQTQLVIHEVVVDTAKSTSAGDTDRQKLKIHGHMNIGETESSKIEPEDQKALQSVEEKEHEEEHLASKVQQVAKCLLSEDECNTSEISQVASEVQQVAECLPSENECSIKSASSQHVSEVQQVGECLPSENESYITSESPQLASEVQQGIECLLSENECNITSESSRQLQKGKDDHLLVKTLEEKDALALHSEATNARKCEYNDPNEAVKEDQELSSSPESRLVNREDIDCYAVKFLSKDCSRHERKLDENKWSSGETGKETGLSRYSGRSNTCTNGLTSFRSSMNGSGSMPARATPMRTAQSDSNAVSRTLPYKKHVKRACKTKGQPDLQVKCWGTGQSDWNTVFSSHGTPETYIAELKTLNPGLVTSDQGLHGTFMQESDIMKPTSVSSDQGLLETSKPGSNYKKPTLYSNQGLLETSIGEADTTKPKSQSSDQGLPEASMPEPDGMIPLRSLSSDQVLPESSLSKSGAMKPTLMSSNQGLPETSMLESDSIKPIFVSPDQGLPETSMHEAHSMESTSVSSDQGLSGKFMPESNGMKPTLISSDQGFPEPFMPGSDAMKPTLMSSNQGLPKTPVTESDIMKPMLVSSDQGLPEPSIPGSDTMKPTLVSLDQDLPDTSILESDSMKPISVSSDQGLPETSIPESDSVKPTLVSSNQVLPKSSMSEADSMKSTLVSLDQGLPEPSMPGSDAVKPTLMSSDQDLPETSMPESDGMKPPSVSLDQGHQEPSMPETSSMKPLSVSSHQGLPEPSVPEADSMKPTLASSEQCLPEATVPESDSTLTQAWSARSDWESTARTKQYKHAKTQVSRTSNQGLPETPMPESDGMRPTLVPSNQGLSETSMPESDGMKPMLESSGQGLPEPAILGSDTMKLTLVSLDHDMPQTSIPVSICMKPKSVSSEQGLPETSMPESVNIKQTSVSSDQEPDSIEPPFASSDQSLPETSVPKSDCMKLTLVSSDQGLPEAYVPESDSTLTQAWSARSDWESSARTRQYKHAKIQISRTSNQGLPEKFMPNVRTLVPSDPGLLEISMLESFSAKQTSVSSDQGVPEPSMLESDSIKPTLVSSNQGLPKMPMPKSGYMKPTSVPSHQDLPETSMPEPGSVNQTSVSSDQGLQEASMSDSDGIKPTLASSNQGLPKTSIPGSNTMKPTLVSLNKGLPETSMLESNSMKPKFSDQGLPVTSMPEASSMKQTLVPSNQGLPETSLAEAGSMKPSSMSSDQDLPVTSMPEILESMKPALLSSDQGRPEPSMPESFHMKPTLVSSVQGLPEASVLEPDSTLTQVWSARTDWESSARTRRYKHAKTQVSRTSNQGLPEAFMPESESMKQTLVSSDQGIPGVSMTESDSMNPTVVFSDQGLPEASMPESVSMEAPLASSDLCLPEVSELESDATKPTLMSLDKGLSETSMLESNSMKPTLVSSKQGLPKTSMPESDGIEPPLASSDQGLPEASEPESDGMRQTLVPSDQGLIETSMSKSYNMKPSLVSSNKGLPETSMPESKSVQPMLMPSDQGLPEPSMPELESMKHTLVCSDQGLPETSMVGSDSIKPALVPSDQGLSETSMAGSDSRKLTLVPSNHDLPETSIPEPDGRKTMLVSSDRGLPEPLIPGSHTTKPKLVTLDQDLPQTAMPESDSMKATPTSSDQGLSGTFMPESDSMKPTLVSTDQDLPETSMPESDTMEPIQVSLDPDLPQTPMPESDRMKPKSVSSDQVFPETSMPEPDSLKQTSVSSDQGLLEAESMKPTLVSSNHGLPKTSMPESDNIEPPLAFSDQGLPQASMLESDSLNIIRDLPVTSNRINKVACKPSTSVETWSARSDWESSARTRQYKHVKNQVSRTLPNKRGFSETNDSEGVENLRAQAKKSKNTCTSISLSDSLKPSVSAVQDLPQTSSTLANNRDFVEANNHKIACTGTRKPIAEKPKKKTLSISSESLDPARDAVHKSSEKALSESDDCKRPLESPVKSATTLKSNGLQTTSSESLNSAREAVHNLLEKAPSKPSDCILPSESTGKSANIFKSSGLKTTLLSSESIDPAKQNAAHYSSQKAMSKSDDCILPSKSTVKSATMLESNGLKATPLEGLDPAKQNTVHNSSEKVLSKSDDCNHPSESTVKSATMLESNGLKTTSSEGLHSARETVHNSSEKALLKSDDCKHGSEYTVKSATMLESNGFKTTSSEGLDSAREAVHNSSEKAPSKPDGCMLLSESTLKSTTILVSSVETTSVCLENLDPSKQDAVHKLSEETMSKSDDCKHPSESTVKSATMLESNGLKTTSPGSLDPAKQNAVHNSPEKILSKSNDCIVLSECTVKSATLLESDGLKHHTSSESLNPRRDTIRNLSQKALSKSDEYKPLSDSTLRSLEKSLAIEMEQTTHPDSPRQNINKSFRHERAQSRRQLQSGVETSHPTNRRYNVHIPQNRPVHDAPSLIRRRGVSTPEMRSHDTNLWFQDRQEVPPHGRLTNSYGPNMLCGTQPFRPPSRHSMQYGSSFGPNLQCGAQPFRSPSRHSMHYGPSFGPNLQYGAQPFCPPSRQNAQYGPRNGPNFADVAAHRQLLYLRNRRVCEQIYNNAVLSAMREGWHPQCDIQRRHLEDMCRNQEQHFPALMDVETRFHPYPRDRRRSSRF